MNDRRDGYGDRGFNPDPGDPNEQTRYIDRVEDTPDPHGHRDAEKPTQYFPPQQPSPGAYQDHAGGHGQPGYQPDYQADYQQQGYQQPEYHQEYQAEPPKRGGAPWGWILGCLVLLLLIIVGLWFIFTARDTGEEDPIPAPVTETLTVEQTTTVRDTPTPEPSTPETTPPALPSELPSELPPEISELTSNLPTINPDEILPENFDLNEFNLDELLNR